MEHPVHVDDTMADVRYSHNFVDMRVGLVIISYYTVPLSVNDEPKETGVVHQSTGGVFVSDTTIRENQIQEDSTRHGGQGITVLTDIIALPTPPNCLHDNNFKSNDDGGHVSSTKDEITVDVIGHSCHDMASRYEDKQPRPNGAISTQETSILFMDSRKTVPNDFHEPKQPKHPGLSQACSQELEIEKSSHDANDHERTSTTQQTQRKK